MNRNSSQPTLQNGTVPPSTTRTTGYNKEPIAKLIGMGELVRNQNPPLQKTNVKNARWFIRPYVDRLQPDGSIKRERERIYLGSCDDVDRKGAGVQRAEVLRRINNGSYVLQSQINFGEFLDLFEKKFVEASAFALSGALLTFFGFMHGESVGLAVTPTVATAYLIVAAFLFALSRYPALAPALTMPDEVLPAATPAE